MKFFVFLILVALGALAYTNPDEAAFREHVKQKTGVAGAVGLAAADVASALTGDGKAVKRDNFIFASKFYVGGDGVLPRKDLAWGAGTKFFEIEEAKK